MRDDEPRQRPVRSPSNGHSSLRPAQPVGYPFLATWQDERQRTRPKPRGEHRSVACQTQTESRDHLARGDEEQEWLSGCATFQLHELLHGFFIHGAAKSVYGLRWVSQHFSCGEMGKRSIDGSLDLLRRPERHHHRLGLHSRKILSASANAKSFSSVIFRARSLPRTTTTGSPICSHSAASSVATRSASWASRCARSMTLRG